uniref:Metaxin n=1 Tax=Ditylenchus dipsaci TaxID=166011 RepID=A0A915EHF6_9BILA
MYSPKPLSKISELHVWPSEFGLPSIETECLQFMVAAKLCAAPITFVYDTKPWKSSSGTFPYFQDESQKITSFEKFVDYLRTCKQDVVLDNELVAAQICEFDVYNCFLKQKLHPAMTQLLWLDHANYSTVTHYWYCSKLPFLYNNWHTERRRRKAQSFIMTSQKSKDQLTLDAIQVLNTLSAKLADNKYFCGDKPCSLDALIFGYLAPLLRLPLPNDRLQLHLSSFDFFMGFAGSEFQCFINLQVRFVESIISIYLPLTESALQEQTNAKKFWAKRRAEAQKVLDEGRMRREQKKAEREGVQEVFYRDTILFVAGATVLCILFALHVGMLEFSSTNLDDDQFMQSIDLLIGRNKESRNRACELVCADDA